MDFRLTPEQAAYRDAVAQALAQDDAPSWPALSRDLGLAGLLLPVARGGRGGGVVEMMLVMEALGQALAATPMVASAVLATTLFDRLGGPAARRHLPGLASGDTTAALAWAEPTGRDAAQHVTTRANQREGRWVIDGRKSLVVGAGQAGVLLVSARTAGEVEDTAGVSLFALDAGTPGLQRRDIATIDGGSAAEIVFEGVSVTDDALLGAPGEAWPPLERALDLATVALSAEAVGVMRRMLEVTLAYARQRRQFGQAIAEFQVIQHRLVDMYMAIERAISAVYLGVLHIDAAPAERSRAVSTTKATVNQAARFVGQSGVQIHGGMGMLNDGLIGRLFRRATAIEHTLGSTDHHLARHARLTRQLAACA